MAKFQVITELHHPKQLVIDSLHDTEFMKGITTALKYAEYTPSNIVKSDDGTRLSRSIRAKPPATLPAFIVKILGDSTGYTEQQDWNLAEGSYTFNFKFDLSAKISCTGKCVFEDLPEGRCRRTADVDLRVGIPIVGGSMTGTFQNKITNSTQTLMVELDKQLAAKTGKALPDSAAAAPLLPEDPAPEEIPTPEATAAAAAAEAAPAPTEEKTQ